MPNSPRPPRAAGCRAPPWNHVKGLRLSTFVSGEFFRPRCEAPLNRGLVPQSFDDIGLWRGTVTRPDMRATPRLGGPRCLVYWHRLNWTKVQYHLKYRFCQWL